MSIVLHLHHGEVTVNGEPLGDGELQLPDADSLLIEGEEKRIGIENQGAVPVKMTVGDLEDGGNEHEIAPGATMTVSGPLPIKLEAANAG